MVDAGAIERKGPWLYRTTGASLIGATQDTISAKRVEDPVLRHAIRRVRICPGYKALGFVNVNMMAAELQLPAKPPETATNTVV